MRGRCAVAAAAICALLLTGCAATVSGAGVRAGTDADAGTPTGSVSSAPGSSDHQSGPTLPSTLQVPASGQGDSGAPSGSSPIRPMPPVSTGAGSSQAPSSDTAPATPSPSTSDTSAPPSSQHGTPAAGTDDPAHEFDGTTSVDASNYHGIVTDVGFQSPSGNITCGIQDGVAVCQIDKFDYTPPKHDCGGSGWGFNFKLESSSAFLFCAGDVESGGPTLDYGQQIAVGAVRCVSQKDGITCQNTGSGYGFRVARAEYVFFGPNEAASTVGASTASGIPAAVIGQWQGHGRVVTIDASGSATLDYRTYQFCSDDPTPPCDKVKDNEIVDGGHIEFALTEQSGAKAATGTVTRSNDPKTPVGSPVTATVSGYNLELSFWPDTLFCAADTPSGQWNCGA